MLKHAGVLSVPPRHRSSPSSLFYRTYLLMNRLWKSLLSKSFTNSFPFPRSSVPLAWFLNTTSSSHRLLTVKSGLFSNGLPFAISFSRCSASAASLSRSSRSRFSCLSLLTRSSSRCSSASSSSESLSSESLSSSSSLSESESLSSASMSRVSSNMRRRFASLSSSSSSAAVLPPSRRPRLVPWACAEAVSSAVEGAGPPVSRA